MILNGHSGKKLLKFWTNNIECQSSRIEGVICFR